LQKYSEQICIVFTYVGLLAGGMQGVCMDKDSLDSRGGVQHSVSLRTLIFAVLTTASIVSGIFVLLHISPATVPLQTTPAGIPGTGGNASKPSAAFPDTHGSTGAEETPSSAPAQAPKNLTDEELFKLEAPSVVLLQVFDQSGQMTKTGSGFVAGPNGIVITNYHMIRGASFEKAVFQDGSTAEVLGVLGYDSSEDLAAIRLNATSAEPLELGDSDSIEVGDRVVAIGSPHGLQNTISDGLVSALRGVNIQTSTPISQGSSGGPFFNQQGQVIGVAVSGVRGAQNLNFVVPINLAKPYLSYTTLTTLSELTAQNTVVRPLLNSTVSIAAGENYELPILIDENEMDNAEFGGNFQSYGGVGGHIRVFVQEQGNGRILYNSGRVTSGQFGLALHPGAYRLVISNTESLLFPRTVTALFGLRFVK
jgi:S1-C subfamily serine protease